MKTETKCKAIATAGQTVMGLAVGIVLNKMIYPECNTAEKVVLWAGSTLLTWPATCKATKLFYKCCDDTFGTDLEECIYD